MSIQNRSKSLIQYLKMLKDNIGAISIYTYIHAHIYPGHSFLKWTPTVQKVTIRIEKWECMKLKNFHTIRKQSTK